MTPAEKIVFIFEIWLFAAIAWSGYQERRRLFALSVTAFEKGRFTVRRTWQDDFELVVIGEVEGKDFHFRINLNDHTGDTDHELCLMEKEFVLRAAPWSFGRGCMNEGADTPILAGLAHRLRYGSIMGQFA